MARRVLVVDDLDEMRVLISRALSADGYEVDVAATLAEAQGLDPAWYDAVLVDARLGSGRGIELIETLRSQDPAAASRCLVITGGALDMIPAGIPVLAKPFQLSDLLAAVRTLHQPDTVPEPDKSADLPADPGVRPPAAVMPAGYQQPGGEPGLWTLLSIVRRMRARERRGLVDYLHDSPIQDLTAASLELQLMLHSLPSRPSPQIRSVLRQVEATSRSLRWLVDELSPFLPLETRLTEAIHQRTAWLLAAPATVAADLRQAGPGRTDAPLVADLVELMLLASQAATPGARAHVAVRTDEHRIQIDLRLTAGREGEPIGDPATARVSLDELASALGASLHTDFSGHQWQTRITVRR